MEMENDCQLFSTKTWTLMVWLCFPLNYSIIPLGWETFLWHEQSPVEMKIMKKKTTSSN